MNCDWISDETEVKEQHFAGILQMHAQICKGVMSRWGDGSPYLYADLYAGPGNLDYKGRQFLGSPLIAQDVLTRIGVPHEAIHFERDPAIAATLAEALWVPTSLLDTPDPDSAPIYAETCQDGFPQWLEERGPQPNRYGLVYADPISDEIPHELFARAAKFMPHVDLLSYVAATQYKRRRGVDSGRPYLLDHVRACGKKFVLIRRPHTAWHWTFILMSNWPLPDWRRQGFYQLDTEHGAQIMDQLNLSNREHHAAANTPLPLEGVRP